MMKIVSILLCLAICLCPLSAYADDYMLGPGDVVNLNVFGIPDLTVNDLPVRPDGKITIPLVGEILVTGLTPAEVSTQLANKLSKYYVNPMVTVSVKTFHTTKVYVVGQVTRPGAYELDKRHNLMDAISAAQGWTQDALKTRVYVIRNGSQGTPQQVNLLDLLQKGDSRKNISLNDGDIVYLSENYRVNISQDILPLINSVWLIRNWVPATSSSSSGG